MDTLYIPPIPRRDHASLSERNVAAYWRYFRALGNNPLEMFVTGAFEDPLWVGKFLGLTYAQVSDPAAIRHVLVTNASNYEMGRVRQVVFKPLLREGLLSAEGPGWKRTRHALTPAFTPRHVAGFAGEMVEVCTRFADRLAEAEPASWNLNDGMTELTLDILAQCLFGGRAPVDARRFGADMEQLLTDHGRPHVLDVFSAPAWIPRSGHGARDRLLADMRAYLQEAVQDAADQARTRAAAPEASDQGTDLLAMLLQARDEAGAPLPDSDIVDNLMTFLAAGHETTAQSLIWAIFLLTQAPDWMGRVQAELDAGAHLDQPPEKWRDLLPTTTAVMNEALRLYPAAGALSRTSIAADMLGDTPIAAKTPVIIVPWVLHRHRTLWRDPDAFDPSRFLGAEGDTIDRFAFVPFGAGPRVCIGASFALQEMVIALATLLARLDFSFVGQDAPIPVMNITLRPSVAVMTSVRARAAAASRQVTPPVRTAS